jgi:hypothetical protein
MMEEGARYARSAEAAAVIVNLLAGDYPGGKAQLYGRVLFCILRTIYQVEEDLGTRIPNPSEN